ncbi:hypothetical protein ACH3VR_13830 [Microbacterium sp. B2969]|uniref:Uncharacterized protein n=1 Tax=Microbacterium alkaliflavum TaxID=3248839 RepID=A0ABW7QAR4_9MICO
MTGLSVERVRSSARLLQGVTTAVGTSSTGETRRKHAETCRMFGAK